mmetsp:Transcript_7201/g.10319  ORF Transcript_7201/g.10319 Transcript_7201/m.10319 type:complete len:178 (+) Transcript_7201:132-665(+)
MAFMIQLSNYLANSFCGGSSRKLIAGWWYTILIISLILILMMFWIIPSRDAVESFITFVSAAVVIFISVGGTMVMRKYHNGVAVGFFMGSVVGSSQFFFLLFLIYLGFIRERKELALQTTEETVQAIICLVQSLLLSSFALILGSHRSEILDQDSTIHRPQNSEDEEESYKPPSANY